MNALNAMLDRLAAEPVGRVTRRAPLCEHSTWRIGGPADLLVEPQSVADLSRALRFASERRLPTVVVGCGSNALFADEGVRGVVIKIGKGLSRFTFHENELEAEAGATMEVLAWAAAERRLSGLEHTVGIPGTLGGLVVMNGGSRRRSIGDVILRVDTLDRQGGFASFSVDACCFGYRCSEFQTNGRIVVGARLGLTSGEKAEIERDMREDLAERERKFPLDLPNCGSVFKSSDALYPVYGPPGKIIEDAGLKGQRKGQAEVSVKHANFIVNLGGASAADVLSLIALVRERVHARTGGWLECEVRYIGSDACILPAHEASLSR
jgi:UDP-N-acetylmuramate dehydrogenase